MAIVDKEIEEEEVARWVTRGEGEEEGTQRVRSEGFVYIVMSVALVVIEMEV